MIVTAFIIFNNDGLVYCIPVLGTSFLIVSFCVFNLLKKSALPFSLNNIVYLFFLFFFGIAPAIQFKSQIHFLGNNAKLSENEFLIGNIGVITIMALYSITYKYFFGNNKTILNNKIEVYNKTKGFDLKKNRILFCSIIIAILVIAFFNFNYEALFLRSFHWKNKGEFSTPILSILNVARGIPLLLFLYYKFYAKKRKLWFDGLLLFFIILCNFPTAIPRYKVAVIYLPIILVYIKQFYKPYRFSLSFVLAFFTVFPYLDHFRYNSNILPKKVFNFSMFTLGHFDSYQNSINIVSNKVISYGDQLLAVLFFYIPRSLWESKSVGSGHVLAEAIDYNGFSNVAVSYFAEGYINFGFIGMFVFTIFLGFFNARFDSYFWTKKTTVSYLMITYLILIPFEFFLLRGSLLASFANLIGYFILILLLSLVLLKTKLFITHIK